MLEERIIALEAKLRDLEARLPKPEPKPEAKEEKSDAPPKNPR